MPPSAAPSTQAHEPHGCGCRRIEVTEGPLAGRTIVVTRSREQASALSTGLRALGAAVIEIPTIAILPPRSYAPLDAALTRWHTYDWLIVTSANTARVLAERLRALERAQIGQPPTVAVGPATAAALRQNGLRVDLEPRPAVAESIVAALKDRVAGQRVLLARAEVARDLLPEALTRAGAHLTLVDAYRTVLAEESRALVAEIFAGASASGPRHRIDALTFTSSSTVNNLAALLEKAEALWPRGSKVFSIGPITSATLRAHGIEPDQEARQHDVGGLIAAVVQGLAGPAAGNTR